MGAGAHRAVSATAHQGYRPDTRSPHTRRSPFGTARLLLYTLSLAAAGLLAWMIALFMGLSAASATAVVVLRTLLSAGALVLVTRAFVRRAYDGSRLPASVLAAAVLSYAVSPAAWAGRALAGQLVLSPGVLTILVDLLLWVAVVLLASRTVAPRPADRPAAPYTSQPA